MKFLSKNKESRPSAKEHERPVKADLNAVCRQIRLLRADNGEIRNLLAAARRDINRIEKSIQRGTQAELEELLSPGHTQEITAEPPLPAIY